MASALAVYATDPTLAGGTYAHTFGFNTPANGTGLDSYNVGSNGAALGLPNNKSQTVLGLLEAADQLAISTSALNANLSGVNAIFNGINTGGNVTNAAASDMGLAYTPAQVRAAYGINSLALDGTGQTIAIVGAYDDPNIFQALDSYDAQFGITSGGPTLYGQYGAASSFLSVLDQNGDGGSLPGTDPTGGWEVEEAAGCGMGPCHGAGRPDRSRRSRQPVPFRPDGRRAYRGQPARCLSRFHELGHARRPGGFRRR